MSKIGNYMRNAISSIANIEHHINIEVFKLSQAINTPTFDDESIIANCKVGDFVMIVGDQVWIQDTNDGKFGQYVKAIYTAEFVRINPLLFILQ
jgi:hypothetical protein